MIYKAALAPVKLKGINISCNHLLKSYVGLLSLCLNCNKKYTKHSTDYERGLYRTIHAHKKYRDYPNINYVLLKSFTQSSTTYQMVITRLLFCTRKN